ncbi:MAG: citrate lyase holo-[acyl-carrier protein] synthase [Bacteroidales bacterium]|nr:citrate lyase holo-[acyl-carrier protein] synthase [Bacteroidales bacterium]
MKISLEQLLESRDARVQHQQALLQAWPEHTLICLTVQFPGPQKRTASSLVVGGAGLAALMDKFGSVAHFTQVKDLATGYEAYLLVPLPATLVKRLCCQIEDTHPLGRLMDIDVLENLHLLDRASIGLPPRRCLLCDNEVRYCMRAKTHTTEELLAKIDEMVSKYCAS